MKTCFKCNTPKDISEFYKHTGMKDGHLNKCKLCSSKDVASNTLKKSDYYKSYEKSRANLPHRIKARHDYIKTESGKKASNEAKKRWRKRNYEKFKAHWTVQNAIARGEMSRENCSICDNNKAECHHADYSKPLEVTWLCDKCHKQEHRKLKGQ